MDVRAELLRTESPAWCHVSSVDGLGGPDVERVRSVLTATSDRHAWLRTVFTRDGDSRTVPVGYVPPVHVQRLPRPAGDLVDTVHALAVASAPALLRPFRRPPVAFVLTEADRTLLTVVAHQAVADRHAIAVLWRDFAALHAGREPDDHPVATPMSCTATGLPLARDPAPVGESGSLRFVLGDRAETACRALVSRLGITRDAVLTAAWAIALSRRCGRSDITLGLPGVTLPLRVTDDVGVTDFLRGVADLVPVTVPVPAAVPVTCHAGPTVGLAHDVELRWSDRPALILDHTLNGADACALACALDTALGEIAARLDHPLAVVRTTAPLAAARPVAREDVWTLVSRAARPAAVAVRDGDTSTTYACLLSAAEQQAAALVAAGVRSGDRVGVALRPSTRELAAVLALLRLGASWVGLDPTTPPAVADAALTDAGATVVLGDRGRLAALGTALNGRRAVVAGATVSDTVPPVADVPGSTTAFVIAGGRVRRADLAGLAPDSGLVRPGTADRFLRLAPLSTAAAATEMFLPLLAGGCVEVFPVGVPVPDSVAEFVASRSVTGCLLPGGLFRQIADYRPAALTGVAEVLVSGDPVAPARVHRVLRACPEIRVIGCAGLDAGPLPVAVRVVTDPADLVDPPPLGRPLPGVDVRVLDHAGRALPDGGIGEVVADGRRTGLLARRDGLGRLRAWGRTDGLIRTADRLLDPAVVADVLKTHPEVEDAVVVAAPGGRLVAGVVAPQDTSLPEALRLYAALRLPEHAVPDLWAITDHLPDPPDATRLTATATAADPVRRAASTRTEPPPPIPQGPLEPEQADDLESAVRSAWEEVLDTEDFGRDDLFFELGGTSRHVLRLRASLLRRIPERRVTVQELYRNPTVARLAEHLRAAPVEQR